MHSLDLLMQTSIQATTQIQTAERINQSFEIYQGPNTCVFASKNRNKKNPFLLFVCIVQRALLHKQHKAPVSVGSDLVKGSADSDAMMKGSHHQQQSIAFAHSLQAIMTQRRPLTVPRNPSWKKNKKKARDLAFLSGSNVKNRPAFLNRGRPL